MSWIAIAGGANGLFFYSFFDLQQEGRADPSAAAGLWEGPARVAAEVTRFAPILLSDRAQDSLSVMGGTPSWLMLRCHSDPKATDGSSGGMYIFAVSDGTGGGAVTLQSSRGRALSSVTIVSETPSRAVKLGGDGKSFSDVIAAMGVVIYKVESQAHHQLPPVVLGHKTDDDPVPTSTTDRRIKSSSAGRHKGDDEELEQDCTTFPVDTM